MRVRAAGWFTFGSALAAAATYGGLGVIGSASSLAAAIVSLGVLAWALVWHLRGRKRVPWGHEHVQARRDLALRGQLGTLYFGSILGVGLLTDMSTPLVYGGAALSLGLGPFGATVYGIAFGFGRSGPAWAAALAGHRFSTREVAPRMIGATHLTRWPGAAVAALGLFMSTVASGWLMRADL